MNLKKFLQSIFHTSDEGRPLNLKDVLYISHITPNQISPTLWVFGFDIIYPNGVLLEVMIYSGVNKIPPALSSFRELCIHNMGYSYIWIDESHKDIILKFQKLQ